MIEAVIVATALTPIGKAYRGAFNGTQGQALAGYAIREAVARAGVERGEIDDVVVTDKASGEISRREVTLSWDEVTGRRLGWKTRFAEAGAEGRTTHHESALHHRGIKHLTPRSTSRTILPPRSALHPRSSPVRAA